MRRITYIITRATRRLLNATATVAATAALALASCATTDELDPNTGAVDPNASLTLSTVAIEGHAATRAAAASDASRAADPASSTTYRPVVDGFVEGDVIQMQYDFAGNASTASTTGNGGAGTAYAQLKSGGVWVIYSDLALATPVKLQPNPAIAGESWENLRISFAFHPRGIVTKDGTLQYDTDASSTADAGSTDPDSADPDAITTYYDLLAAATRVTTDATVALGAGQYRIGTDGTVSACFAHSQALLALPLDAISVSDYPEAYNGITAITAIIAQNNADGTLAAEHCIAFTLNGDTWQAIAPATAKPATAEPAAATYTLSSLTATLTKDGTPGANPAKFTARISSAPVPLRPGTRYGLKLTVAPAHSTAAITGATTGWGKEEDMQSIDYILATPGDMSSHWKIYSARGLADFSSYVNSIDYTDPNAVYPDATLAVDIDLKGSATNPWTPIGKDADHPYSGTFDGAGHTVSGLYIDDTQSGLDGNYRGLFGLLKSGTKSATVKRLTVKGSLTCALTNGAGFFSFYVGGIAGDADATTLTDCHSEVSVSATVDGSNSTNVYAGGIVGNAFSSNSNTYNWSNCTSTGTVAATILEGGTGEVRAGGICGYSSQLLLTGCKHTTGAVTATAPKGGVYAGGIVGRADNGNAGSQLLGCTNTAAVSGTATGTSSSIVRIGGVAGQSYVKIVACSNSGAITYNAEGALRAGGVVGETGNTVDASFSTQIPTMTAGGSGGTDPYIGGVIGDIGTNDATDAPYAVSACFYVSESENDGMGINGIGFGNDDANNNKDAGPVATLAELNGKVDVMNDAINAYNAITTEEAAKCPYRWAAGTNPDTDAPHAAEAVGRK